MRRVTLAILIVAALFAPAIDAQQAPAARIADRTGGVQRTDGFIPFYWDAARGRVLIEIPAFGEDVLYYVSAASGAGSVELPFDRGILANRRDSLRAIGTARAGGRSRTSTIAPSAAPPRRSRTCATRSPSSVLAALPVEADESGRVLVDATPLFMRDAANVEGRLRRANQGAFRFDAARSALLPAAHESVPAEHRDRDRRHLRGRQSGPARQQRHAGWPRVHAAHPPLVPEGARRLSAAAGRSAHRRQRA